MPKEKSQASPASPPAAPPTDAPAALAAQHMRWFALIVDYLLVVVVLKMAEQVMLPARWDLTPHALESGNPWNWVALVFLTLMLRDLPWGRGLGKYIVGITVVRADNPLQRPGVVALLIRNATLILLPLEGVLVFTHPFFRRLGDRLSGTVVVAPVRVAPALRRFLVLAIVFLASLLASFLLGRHNLFRTAAYQVAERAMRADPAVMRTVGDTPAPGSDANIAWPLEPGLPATVSLMAEGALGEAKVEVLLMRIGTEAGWRVQEVRLVTPPAADLEQKEAPRVKPAQ